MAMMAITTNSSINVNADRLEKWFLIICVMPDFYKVSKFRPRAGVGFHRPARERACAPGPFS
jgi:hypothetical protein